MMQPPEGGSVGFYDEPDDDTIEMVLSPEDMRKLSRAAGEQPITPNPGLGEPRPSPEPQRSPDVAQAAPLAAAAPMRWPPAPQNPAPKPESTKAQAEHLLHAPHEPAQTKLPTASSPADAPRADKVASVAASAPQVAQSKPAPTTSTQVVPQPQATSASSTSPAGAGPRLPQAAPSESRRPPDPRKNAAATTGLPPNNRKPALIAGGALAAIATVLLVLGTTGSWSTATSPSSQGIEQQQPSPPATPTTQPQQPPLASPQAPAAVAPAEQPQPTEGAPATTPIRFKNPFDRSEIFEFPAGTSLEDARQSVANLLLQRARDRHLPGVAQRRGINGRPATDTGLVQNSVRAR